MRFKLELMYAALIVAVILICLIQPYFESRTYNRLTGAQTTWWDAIWVELRVQDTPKQKD